MLEHHTINVQMQDAWTPLHAACMHGNAELVRYLLKLGASYQAADSNGELPLHVACKEVHELIDCIIGVVTAVMFFALYIAMAIKGCTRHDGNGQYQQPHHPVKGCMIPSAKLALGMLQCCGRYQTSKCS